jgi:hypothetical protein
VPHVCAIHQPNLLPRLSTLAKLYAADTWVVLDDVQYNGRDYQNRARLARLDDPEKWQWLTLPVRRPDGRATLIRDVRLIDQRQARHRIARLLHQLYRTSPHWLAFRAELDPVLDLIEQTDQLSAVTELSTLVLLRQLGWTGRVLRSSDLPSRPDRSARLADLTTAVGADTYLCGPGGRRYLDTTPFAEQGLAVRWFEPGSTSRVSAVSELMRDGPAPVRDALNG